MNTPHPELEVLAELAERADLPEQPAPPGGPPAAAPATTAYQAEAQAHVAQCERCTAEVAALRDVRATLRSLPAPTMPDGVASRLEAAVRAEAVAQSGAATRRSGWPPAPVVALPKRSARHGAGGAGRGGLPAMPAAAAVVVLVVIALGVGIGVLATRGHNHSASMTSTAPNAGQGLPPVGGAPAQGAEPAARRIASGTEYETTTIRSQVAALVLSRLPDAARTYAGLSALASTSQGAAAAAAPSAPHQDPVSAPPTAPSGPLASVNALDACVQSLVGQPETPLLVDYALFQGKPATVIVLPDPVDSSRLDVYVESNTDDCAAGDLSYWGSLNSS